VAVYSGGATGSSLNYFVLPFLADAGVKASDIELNPSADKLASGDFNKVVIVRYWGLKLLLQLCRLRSFGIQLIYFMDDDLFDRSAWSGLPLSYQRTWFTRAYIYKVAIKSLVSEVWVSSPRLYEKYSKLCSHVRVLRPNLSKALISKDRGEYIHIGYHGSAAHAKEIDWLVSVMTDVTRQFGAVRFEIFGGEDVARKFRGLPSVAVLNPMSWPNYLDYTQSRRMDIGLAPLLPTEVNMARAPTKWFDYARMGAVGLYSETPPYAGFVNNGEDGFLLPNSKQRWVEAILELCHDVTLLKEMRQSVAVRYQSHINAARDNV
jgi:hypothetical protein